MKAQRFNSQTEPDLCGAKSPNGAFCSRTFRHRGEHQAFGPDTKQHAGIVYERWPRAAARLRARPQQEETWMRIYKVQAMGDTVYVAASDLKAAKAKIADVMGAEVVPLCTFTPVDKLPDDEELL